jgi:hypothetical protein
MRRLSVVLVAFAAVMLFAANALAQSDQARVSGTVKDQTGGLLPGVTVTATNERTGEQRIAVTNTDGFFVIAALRPSDYTIVADLSGFGKVEKAHVTLAAAQTPTFDLELRPAGVTETVIVEASTPTLDLSSARIGANVSDREVHTLPVNGRQMSQLLLQAPGSQNAGTGTWQDIRFSGRAVSQNAIRYDGVEASAIIDAMPGNLNGQIASPFKLQNSLENVQEFRVESSSFPAEFGTGTGGQVSVVTKSGSNILRGSVFEYFRSDKLDAPNYFDTLAGLPKSTLRQHQFGTSLGGPIFRNKAFFFGTYEGYRLEAGLNFVEATPSEAAWARAVPAIQQLRPGFLAPGAVILAGASTNPDFDIAQLQDVQRVNEDAFSVRLDFRLNPRWSSSIRVLHDDGTNRQPEGVSGRIVQFVAKPTNVVFNLQGVMSDRTINEFKIGYNGAKTTTSGLAPTVNGIDFSKIAINLSGSVANTGIAGQGSSSGITVPGGLIRGNSAGNLSGFPLSPYSLTFSDSLSQIRGSHSFKFGGEIRMIRMAFDQLNAITYTYQNLTAFLANQTSSIQLIGDLSAPSVFNNGASGLHHTEQEYYVGYAQDEWRVSPRFTVNYGLRYDYYTPLRERDNRIVKFNIITGALDPNATPIVKSRKSNFQPRLAATYALTPKTVLRGGFGIVVGPGQTEDLIQPIESDAIRPTLSGTNAFPIDPALLVSSFVNNPATRAYQPRAYANDYTFPEKVYQYTVSFQRELPGQMTATAAYVGSQGRNLFVRSVANKITQVITNANPANAALVVREFSIVQRDAAGNVTGVQNPYAEVDYKDSIGRDSYNALQLALTRRAGIGLTTNVQYTLAKSWGTSAGSNEAQTAANLARTEQEFEYDLGYNNFDVRHSFTVSALYSLPFGPGRRFGAASGRAAQAFLGGWDLGLILNARSGVPIDLRVVRPDVVYRDAAGTVFNNPAAGRTAVINTPGGGSTRNVRRPNCVAGVDPYVNSGGVTFLNPAAFSTPAPGTWGDCTRNFLHGPGFNQTDLVLSKRVMTGGGSSIEFRTEVFNLLNTNNFSNPVGTLPNALPNAALTEANRVQPGQPFTTAAAGTFGAIQGTAGRTVGLGTNRQIQFSLRMNF